MVFDGDVSLKGQLQDVRIVRATHMTLFAEAVREQEAGAAHRGRATHTTTGTAGARPRTLHLI